MLPSKTLIEVFYTLQHLNVNVMSAVLGSGRAAYSGFLALRSSFRCIFTYKMADKPVDYTNSNGIESKTPFLIGVAGGTASGKVST